MLLLNDHDARYSRDLLCVKSTLVSPSSFEPESTKFMLVAVQMLPEAQAPEILVHPDVVQVPASESDKIAAMRSIWSKYIAPAIYHFLLIRALSRSSIDEGGGDRSTSVVIEAVCLWQVEATWTPVYNRYYLNT